MALGETRNSFLFGCLIETGIEDSYSWMKNEDGVGLSTRLELTDQRAIRTRSSARKHWSYLVVALPNSGLQIGTWTMVYDEGFEVSCALLVKSTQC